MRITRPAPGARVPLDEINLADTDLYTKADAHLVWQTLRSQRPVFWQQQPRGEGFWVVTRRADVRRVLSEHETFSSEGGTAIAMLDAPDPSAGLMMQATDPPRHQRFREKMAHPFSTGTVPGYARQARSFARDAIATAADGGVWDVADAFSRLPMTLAATIMGLPDADIDPLMRLAYASLAPLDPRYSAGTKAAAIATHYEIIGYFDQCISERKKNLSTDLISDLIRAEVEGRRLTDDELVLNCLSLLLGAVVTTSQVISATFMGMAEQQGGEGRWAPDTPVQLAVEEALRWSSPVTHFMRRACHDTRMYGERIRAGEAVTAWIASANRDETVFERPYTIDLRRAPNRHVVFGVGPHRCLGTHLARLMLRESFAELMARIEAFELAGEPSHLVSNEIAGVVSLPLRVRLRPGAGLVSEAGAAAAATQVSD
jgi:cytochrome P450